MPKVLLHCFNAQKEQDVKNCKLILKRQLRFSNISITLELNITAKIPNYVSTTELPEVPI